MSPWIEEVEGAANKLVRGDTVLPVAHHRSVADVVEEVCGEDRANSPNVSDQQPLSPQATFTPQTNTQAKSERPDALIIQAGWEHHTGGSG